MVEDRSNGDVSSGDVNGDEEKGEQQRYSVEYETPCHVRIRIEADGTDLQEEYEQQFGTYQQNAQIPGFRRGKAPRAMVEKRFAEAVKEQVLHSAASEVLSEAIAKEGITVINELESPDFKNIRWDPGEPASFEYKFEVVPSIDLNEEQYKGIKIKAPSKEIPEDVFESALERFARRFSEWKELDGSVCIDREDSVQVALRVTEPDPESELRENRFHFRPDGGRVGPFVAEGLNGAVTGCKKGDTVVVKGRVAEDALGEEADPDPALAGLEGVEEVSLELEIGNVHRLETPEIDDQMAEKMGLENAGEIREAVRSQVESDIESQRHEAIRSELLSELADCIELELPDSLIEQAAEENRRRAALDAWREEGKDLEQARKEAAEEDSFEQQAARHLKTEFLLKQIGDRERIYVSESELENQIRALAARRGTDQERMRRMLEKNDMLDSLRRDLRRAKVIDMLLENAELNEVEWSEFGGGDSAE